MDDGEGDLLVSSLTLIEDDDDGEGGRAVPLVAVYDDDDSGDIAVIEGGTPEEPGVASYTGLLKS